MASRRAFRLAGAAEGEGAMERTLHLQNRLQEARDRDGTLPKPPGGRVVLGVWCLGRDKAGERDELKRPATSFAWLVVR
jgi:hypothetical protein